MTGMPTQYTRLTPARSMMAAICLARLSYSSSHAFFGYITLLPPATMGMPLSLAPIMKTPTS